MKLATADAVVIGGGIIGTAAAYYLARDGLMVALVERKGIGSGTSSACHDGLVLQTKAPGPTLSLAAASVGMYRGLGEELGCDLEFRNDGAMVIALTEPEVEYVSGLVGRLTKAGVPVEMLDNAAALQMQPALSPALLAATFCALDCHVNPLRVTSAFARAATRLGARFYLGTTAIGVNCAGGRVTGVETSVGRIDSPVVVNAAGVWAPVVSRMVGLELGIVPRRGQILVTEALPPTIRGRLSSARYLMGKLRSSGHDGESPSGYASGMFVGQQAAGNVLIGATREYVGEDASTTPGAVADLAAQAVALLPILGRARIIRSYAGLRPAPTAGKPTIQGYSHPEGFVVAAGHEGDGICLAPVTGRIVADIVAGHVQDYRQHHLLSQPLVPD